MQLGLGLFLTHLHHLLHYPVRFFCLFLHFLLEFIIASDEILFSNSGFFQFCFCRGLVFLNCLFSFSNSAFLCSKVRSVETGLILIFDNQLMFSSLRCIPVGMKSVAFLALKLRGVRTQVLSTFTS